MQCALVQSLTSSGTTVDYMNARCCPGVIAILLMALLTIVWYCRVIPTVTPSAPIATTAKTAPSLLLGAGLCCCGLDTVGSSAV